MGGRASKALIFDGEVSTGAADDLQRATEIALQMVTRFGMDETVGQRTYPSRLVSARRRTERTRPTSCGCAMPGRQVEQTPVGAGTCSGHVAGSVVARGVRAGERRTARLHRRARANGKYRLRAPAAKSADLMTQR
jgi:peptidase M41-like protein